MTQCVPRSSQPRVEWRAWLRTRAMLLIGNLLIAALWSSPAQATFSVLLTNTQTRELGGAVTSCVGEFDLTNIFAEVATPAGQRVAVFTQSWFSEENHHRAQSLLAAGEELNAVLKALIEPTFDPYFADRQYHLLRTDGSGTTWTGTDAGQFAGGITGSVGAWSFTAAGNILTSELVLTAIDGSLRSSSGAITERLLRALEAVERSGEGDSRCTPLPGDSAFLGAVDANGSHTAWVSVVDTAPQSAVQRLRQVLEQADTNAPVLTSAAERTSEPTLDAGVSVSSAPPADPKPTRASGCGCAVNSRPAWWFWGSAMLLVVTRRRSNDR